MLRPLPDDCTVRMARLANIVAMCNRAQHFSGLTWRVEQTSRRVLVTVGSIYTARLPLIYAAEPINPFAVLMFVSETYDTRRDPAHNPISFYRDLVRKYIFEGPQLVFRAGAWYEANANG